MSVSRSVGLGSRGPRRLGFSIYRSLHPGIGVLQVLAQLDEQLVARGCSKRDVHSVRAAPQGQPARQPLLCGRLEGVGRRYAARGLLLHAQHLEEPTAARLPGSVGDAQRAAFDQSADDNSI